MDFQEAGLETIVQGPPSDGVAGIPVTVGLAGGGYVVIWQTTDQAPPGDVYARIYNAVGAPQGGAFRIFDDYVNFSFPRNVDAVALPGGGFAIASVRVTATDALYQPTASDIVLQLFSATGNATTGVITVNANQGLPSYRTEPAIAIAGNQIMVAWDDGSQILANTFDLGGRFITSYLVDLGRQPETPFDSRYDTRSPAVTGLADGSFLVAYRQSGTDAGDITYRFYRSDSNTSGGYLPRSGIQAMPHVATLANGNAILTWADYSGTTVILRGQVIAADGSRLGNELVLADTTVLSQDQSGKVDGTTLNDYGLTALAGGGFAVSWGANQSFSRVTVREFSSNGTALRDATAVSDSPGYLPHIAALAGGGYEVVWSSNQTQSVFAQTIADVRTVFTPGVVKLADFNRDNGWTYQSSTPRHVADINGDGFADIVGFGSAGVYISYGSASGTFSHPVLGLGNFGQASGWSSDDLYHRTLADLNGDGRADVIGFGQAGTLVSLGNGDGTFQAPVLGLHNFGADQGWVLDNVYHHELADVNGDGKADIVGFGKAGTYVALSNGDGTFGNAAFTLADFGTDQGWSNNDTFTRLVTDINGDGKADIVGFSNGGTLVAFGNGDGTFQPLRDDVADFGSAQGYTSDTLYHRELADVNGDGFCDVVGFTNAGVIVGLSQAASKF